MRKALLSTVASLAVIVPMSLTAAEISQDGADQIKEKLTYYLPKDIVDTGFLKVLPAADRYELSVDFMPFLKDVKPEVFTINGLKPFVYYLTPQDDETWKVEANDNLDLSGKFTAEGKTQAFTYKIDRMMFDSIFDPSISYFTDGKYSMDKIALTMTGAEPDINMTADSMSGEMKGTKVGEGLIDLGGHFQMSNLAETVSGKSMPPVLISAASMSGTVEAKKLGVNAFRDLVVFGLDLVKAKTDKLDEAQAAKLKTLIKANIPFTEQLDEQLKFEGVKFSGQGMEVSLESFTYGLGFNGIRKDTTVSFNMGVTRPVIPASILPPGIEGVVPDAANISVTVGKFNLEDAANYMLEHANFAAPTPMTPEQDAELGRIVLPDNKILMEFKDTYAKSAVYDVSVTGTMAGDMNNSDKPEIDVTITARDLDKTIKYLQDNSAKVPEFGQASFMVMMMKGFGKAEADGSIVWNVKMDPSGKVLINGQEMKI